MFASSDFGIAQSPVIGLHHPIFFGKVGWQSCNLKRPLFLCIDKSSCFRIVEAICCALTLQAYTMVVFARSSIIIFFANITQIILDVIYIYI